MVDPILSTNTAIIELAEQYATVLISGGITKSGYFNSKPVVPCSDLLPWHNRENIDSGASGIVLFLIELYKQSANNRYLQLAGEIIDNILAYCRNNDTNNYSLYTGRAGVVYVLLEYWRLTQNDDLIKEALSLIRPCNKGFLNSDHSSDYLYDGRAGTLLVLFCLYQFTKESFLTGYIDQFVTAITGNMQSSADGFYWCAKGELAIRPSCSFAFGTAGIKYVFTQLRKYMP
ncbi:MAG TPA: lanthionine synthetase LanC family protein, partial [Niastella sp.]